LFNRKQIKNNEAFHFSCRPDICAKEKSLWDQNENPCQFLTSFALTVPLY